jgi:hypothetical protein
VLRPRFDALRGDPTRFHLLSGFATRNGDQPGAPLAYAQRIDRALCQTQARLLIVDSLQSFLDAAARHGQDTGCLLEELRRLGAEHHCGILLVRHLSKPRTGRAPARNLGALGLGTIARSELLAGAWPHGPQPRALLHVKSSLAPLGPALAYYILDNGDLGWGAPVTDFTAASLLAPETTSEEKNALASAICFLSHNLEEAPHEATEMLAEARILGISPATLRRAKILLGVQSVKRSPRGPWLWQLPEGDEPENAIA